jgi:hypothetical protein
VKFETTPAFDGDVRRLKRSGLYGEFRDVVKDEFIPAAERRVREPGRRWPARLRVKSVRGAPGVLEMTWSFSRPDGRATFEWVQIDEESGIRWRRVGDHSIFGNP